MRKGEAKKCEQFQNKLFLRLFRCCIINRYESMKRKQHAAAAAARRSRSPQFEVNLGRDHGRFRCNKSRAIPPFRKKSFWRQQLRGSIDEERLIAGHGHAAVLVTCVNNAVKISGKTNHRKKSKLIWLIDYSISKGKSSLHLVLLLPLPPHPRHTATANLGIPGSKRSPCLQPCLRSELAPKLQYPRRAPRAG